MGLRPVGLVQGFCAMQWGWYGGWLPVHARASPPTPRPAAGRRLRPELALPARLRLGRAPHLGPELRADLGRGGLAPGLRLGVRRLIEEAKEVGAHGVIGVTDTSHALADTNVAEFHVLGTAVVVEDGPRRRRTASPGPPTWPASAWPS